MVRTKNPSYIEDPIPEDEIVEEENDSGDESEETESNPRDSTVCLVIYL